MNGSALPSDISECQEQSSTQTDLGEEGSGDNAIDKSNAEDTSTNEVDTNQIATSAESLDKTNVEMKEVSDIGVGSDVGIDVDNKSVDNLNTNESPTPSSGIDQSRMQLRSKNQYVVYTRTLKNLPKPPKPCKEVKPGGKRRGRPPKYLKNLIAEPPQPLEELPKVLASDGVLNVPSHSVDAQISTDDFPVNIPDGPIENIPNSCPIENISHEENPASTVETQTSSSVAKVQISSAVKVEFPEQNVNSPFTAEKVAEDPINIPTAVEIPQEQPNAPCPLEKLPGEQESPPTVEKVLDQVPTLVEAIPDIPTNTILSENSPILSETTPLPPEITPILPETPPQDTVTLPQAEKIPQDQPHSSSTIPQDQPHSSSKIPQDQPHSSSRVDRVPQNQLNFPIPPPLVAGSIPPASIKGIGAMPPIPVKGISRDEIKFPLPPVKPRKEQKVPTPVQPIPSNLVDIPSNSILSIPRVPVWSATSAQDRVLDLSVRRARKRRHRQKHQTEPRLNSRDEPDVVEVSPQVDSHVASPVDVAPRSPSATPKVATPRSPVALCVEVTTPISTSATPPAKVATPTSPADLSVEVATPRSRSASPTPLNLAISAASSSETSPMRSSFPSRRSSSDELVSSSAPGNLSSKPVSLDATQMLPRAGVSPPGVSSEDSKTSPQNRKISPSKGVPSLLPMKDIRTSDPDWPRPTASFAATIADVATKTLPVIQELLSQRDGKPVGKATLPSPLKAKLSDYENKMKNVRESIRQKRLAQGLTCLQCGRSYCRPYNLKRHIQYECGKAPQFPCLYCSYRARHKHDLKKHVTFKHAAYLDHFQAVQEELEVTTKELSPGPKAENRHRFREFLNEHRNLERNVSHEEIRTHKKHEQPRKESSYKETENTQFNSETNDVHKGARPDINVVNNSAFPTNLDLSEKLLHLSGCTLISNGATDPKPQTMETNGQRSYGATAKETEHAENDFRREKQSPSSASSHDEVKNEPENIESGSDSNSDGEDANLGASDIRDGVNTSYGVNDMAHVAANLRDNFLNRLGPMGFNPYALALNNNEMSKILLENPGLFQQNLNRALMFMNQYNPALTNGYSL
ncbi:hypothetical protein M8J75_004392 [Diaphorina citri]|nr:hypothetical protein M8J75_004392 [Diaphorina citri]